MSESNDFHDLIANNKIEKPKAVDAYVEVNARAHAKLNHKPAKLSKAARLRLLWFKWESGNLDPTSEEAHELARVNLNLWSSFRVGGNWGEIKKACGVSKDSSIGRLVKRNNGAGHVSTQPVIQFDETKYFYLNTVVLSLTPDSYNLIQRHYILRDKPMKEYLDGLNIDSKKYYQTMIAPIQEFILKGGIGNGLKRICTVIENSV